MKQFAHTWRGNEKVKTRTQIPQSRRAFSTKIHLHPLLYPMNIWQCLEKFWVVTRWGMGHKYLAGRGQTAVKHPTMHGTAAHDNQQPAPALHSGECHPGHCGALTHVPTAPGPAPHGTAAGRHASDGTWLRDSSLTGRVRYTPAHTLRNDTVNTKGVVQTKCYK